MNVECAREGWWRGGSVQLCGASGLAEVSGRVEKSGSLGHRYVLALAHALPRCLHLRPWTQLQPQTCRAQQSLWIETTVPSVRWAEIPVDSVGRGKTQYSLSLWLHYLLAGACWTLKVRRVCKLFYPFFIISLSDITLPQLSNMRHCIPSSIRFHNRSRESVTVRRKNAVRDKSIMMTISGRYGIIAILVRSSVCHLSKDWNPSQWSLALDFRRIDAMIGYSPEELGPTFTLRRGCLLVSASIGHWSRRRRQFYGEACKGSTSFLRNLDHAHIPEVTDTRLSHYHSTNDPSRFAFSCSISHQTLSAGPVSACDRDRSFARKGRVSLADLILSYTNLTRQIIYHVTAPAIDTPCSFK
ncbi:hypothetical protein BCR34DRAFT_106662 [Clohesyomyces aquaticus]|uniref:Uncharacterized protein n=1 Tax=Clohesyomyces aquaticus TaxID=1231657 RepID=A0A1Y2A1S3_9PLEO|nr:hypothetical protein BCR34DRAFT_106662 [Clohesyomyces aquaticus]